jgi:hypothetical protein
MRILPVGQLQRGDVIASASEAIQSPRFVMAGHSRSKNGLSGLRRTHCIHMTEAVGELPRV